MPPPKDRAGVLRIVGMATYLAKFVPKFSEILNPIRSLLSEDTEFRWDEYIHSRAFTQLKRMLVEAPTLSFYDITQPVVIQCDASMAVFSWQSRVNSAR